MAVAKQMTKCPYCKETIDAGASRCRYCHSDIEMKKETDSFWQQYNTFRFGFLSGILFTITLFVLVYYQFFAGE